MEKFENAELHLGDCIEIMNSMEENSIDSVIVDLPYGTTQNKWDVIIPFDKLWESLLRITKDTSNMVFTASQPFTSQLVCSNIKMFRHEIIWEKTIGSGQLNIKHQPLKVHESILIFNKKLGAYNPQMVEGEPYKIHRKLNKYGVTNYNEQKDHVSVNDGFRHPRSVIKISNPRIKGGHKTQKPVELMDFIIKTFSNENDKILDCCMGTASTGISCLKLNRYFIGIEKDPVFFDVSKDRVKYYIENSSDKY